MNFYLFYVHYHYLQLFLKFMILLLYCYCGEFLAAGINKRIEVRLRDVLEFLYVLAL